MDKIQIEEFEFSCKLGVTPEERATPQNVLADIELSLDTSKAAQSDNIRDTIDFTIVCDLVQKNMTGEYLLVERLAEDIAALILRNVPALEVRVRLRKREVAKQRNAKYFGVEIVRASD